MTRISVGIAVVCLALASYARGQGSQEAPAKQAEDRSTGVPKDKGKKPGDNQVT